jgi:hypothetical protein
MSGYVLAFTPEPGCAVPEGQRLRALLKAAKRVYGFKCVRINPTGNHEETH